MKRRERFASAEHGDPTLLLPWLMKYIRRTSTRQSGEAREATDADMFKRASLVCRHPGGVTVQHAASSRNRARRGARKGGSE